MHLVRGSWWGWGRDRMWGWEDTPDLHLVNYSLRRAVIRVWPLCWLIITWLPYWILRETFENLYFKSSSDLFDQRCTSGTIIWIKVKVIEFYLQQLSCSCYVLITAMCISYASWTHFPIASVLKNNHQQT